MKPPRLQDLPEPRNGFTIDTTSGLYTCLTCGWWVLPIDAPSHGKDRFKPCAKTEGAHADALAKRVPEVSSTKHGYGYGKLTFEVDQDTHLKLVPHRSGRFTVEDLYFLGGLTAAEAEKFVRFLVELRKDKP